MTDCMMIISYSKQTQLPRDCIVTHNWRFM